MTVVVIILILSLLLVESYQSIQQNAESAKCLTNLSGLYVGVSSYVQEQGYWPQINPTLAAKEYAQEWITALARYGVSRQSWLCPTVQRTNGNPDVSLPQNVRVDYVATPFDNKPRTPYRWTTQPWFIEKGAPHPGGNLIIYEDGTTLTLVQAAHRPSPAQN